MYPDRVIVHAGLEREHERLIWSNFNSLTVENDIKPLLTHPEEYSYEWGPAARIAGFANANYIKVNRLFLCLRGHTPEWLHV